MPVRRSLPAAVLTAALFVTAGSAAAQRGQPTTPPGSHQPLSGGLSADQVRRALGFPVQGADAPPGLAGAARDQLLKEFPNLPPETAERWIKSLMGDEQFMKMVRDRAAKRAEEGARTPLDKDPGLRTDLAQWLKKNPPKLDGEKDRRPDDAQPPTPPRPRPGQPAEPPGGDDARPIPPGGDGGAGGGFNPADPPRPAPKVPFVPDLDAPETPREKGMRAAMAMWERNVGPLDETPGLKGLLFDIVEGSDEWGDWAGGEGGSFWDSLSKEGGDGSSFADFIDKSAAGDGWGDFGKWEWPKLPTWLGGGGDGPKGGMDAPDVGGGGGWFSGWKSNRPAGGPRSPGSSWGFSGGGVEGSWWPVVILAAVLVGGLLVWRFWYLADPRAADPTAADRFKDWPVDPRDIATRADVIVTFEYLSVLLCGPSAQTWTHNTIAGALAELALTHGAEAVVLARLYELARYAPADEPLTPAEVAEARRLVCGLAGMDAA